jgi:hypothetical protein
MNRIEKRKIYLDYLESINESKDRDKKINKVVEKIHKFVKHKGFIDYLIDKVVSHDSTKGLKYLIWIANATKKRILTTAYHNETDAKVLKLFLEEGVVNDKLTDLYITNIDKEYLESSLNNKIRTEFIDNDIFLTTIIDWLKSPLRENEETNLNNYDFITAYQEAERWHNSLGDSATGHIENEIGNILMTFDDGYYWIDLETPYDKDEAEAMGHCGNTTEGTTLYSLRKAKSPHVTMAVNEDDFTITQCKGRGNKKPIEKYHKYIVDLMVWENFVASDIMLEYDTGDDFSADDLNPELYRKLIKDNPNWLGSDFDIQKFLKNFENDYEIYNKMSNLSIMKFLLEMNNTTFVDEETGDVVEIDRGFDKLLDWVQKNKQIKFKSSDAIIELKNNKFYFEKEKGWFLGIKFIEAQSNAINRSFDNVNFMWTVVNIMSELKLDFNNIDKYYKSILLINNMNNAIIPSTYDTFDVFANVVEKIKKLTKKYDDEIHIPKLKEEQENFYKYLSQLGINDIKIKGNKIHWYVDAKLFLTNIKTIDSFDDFISNWRKYLEDTIQNNHYIFEYDIIDEYNKYIIDNIN